MLYYATPSGQLARDAMRNGLLGMINTPAQNSRPIPGVNWCADNGRYGNGWPGYHRWARWLDRQPREHCSFAVAPDVVGDAARTLRQFGPASRLIHRMGFPVAYAAQNGSEHHPPPWGDFQVLFIGGDDTFKLGPIATELMADAHDRGIETHVGRVTTLGRLRWCLYHGADSADSTTLTRGGDKALRQLLTWLRELNHQGTLWEAS